jgi:hypothetical protein
MSDVAAGGELRERSTVIQQMTGRPVPFEITEPPVTRYVRGCLTGAAGATTGFFPAAVELT